MPFWFRRRRLGLLWSEGSESYQKEVRELWYPTHDDAICSVFFRFCFNNFLYLIVSKDFFTITFLLRARSAIDLRAILPERVFGRVSTPLTRRNAATGPTNSRTSWTASLLISSSDFVFARRGRSGCYIHYKHVTSGPRPNRSNHDIAKLNTFGCDV